MKWAQWKIKLAHLRKAWPRSASDRGILKTRRVEMQLGSEPVNGTRLIRTTLVGSAKKFAIPNN